MFGWLFRLFGGGKKRKAEPIKHSKKQKKAARDDLPVFTPRARGRRGGPQAVEPAEAGAVAARDSFEPVPIDAEELPPLAGEDGPAETASDSQATLPEDEAAVPPETHDADSGARIAPAFKKEDKKLFRRGKGDAKGPAARILMQQGVEGEFVRRLQLALSESGFDLGEIDGVFGRLTERAVKFWQKKFGAESTGAVTFDQWAEVTGQPVPDLFERCLQLTSSFEGHGFTKVAGNFDNAGLTWGLIGYNLRSRTLQPILDYFIDYHPELVRDAFGRLAEDLVKVVESPIEDQIHWADSISIGSQKHRIRRDWAEGFTKFGAIPEVQQMQSDQARENYWQLAEVDAGRFDLTSELGKALAFDIAVQNGGIDGGLDDGPERRAILARIEEENARDERARRAIIAEVVAQNSNPKFIEDVLARKKAIAVGDGVVHGKIYHLKHWGLDDVTG